MIKKIRKQEYFVMTREYFGISESFFDIFENIAEAVYFCDTKGRLVYMNGEAQRQDGMTLAKVKGKTIKEIYGLEENASPLLKALSGGETVREEQVIYSPHGRKTLRLFTAKPFYLDGTLFGAYSVQRDITDVHHIVEENLSLQWEVLRQKQQSSHGGENEIKTALVGDSLVFSQCRETAFRAAKQSSPVLLVGATGSGKEMFARFIHDNSERSEKPFLALNCAAIPESLLEGILFGTAKGVYTGAVEREGLFSQADGGTIFLDEINSMALSSQAKLLRVLEEKSVCKLGAVKGKDIDVRIISSSNEQPAFAVENGSLRQDLFYRLSVVYIQIPPLTCRREDIPLLVNYFIGGFNRSFQKNVIGVTDEVMSFFSAYEWPGNVRQLKNSIESAMNFTEDGQWISFISLPPYLFEPLPVQENSYIEEVSPVVSEGKPEVTVMEKIHADEKEEMIAALKKSRGNMAAAARDLGITRQTMVYRVKKYGLK